MLFRKYDKNHFSWAGLIRCLSICSTDLFIPINLKGSITTMLTEKHPEHMQQFGEGTLQVLKRGKGLKVIAKLFI